MPDVAALPRSPYVSPWVVEPEVMAGRRAFATAQQLLFGSPEPGDPLEKQLGWYDTSVHPDRGSFALVRYSAALADLVGEVVRLDYGSVSVFAYVLQEADLPLEVDLAVTRRLFIALGRLSLTAVTAKVWVTA